MVMVIVVLLSAHFQRLSGLPYVVFFLLLVLGGHAQWRISVATQKTLRKTKNYTNMTCIFHYKQEMNEMISGGLILGRFYSVIQLSARMKILRWGRCGRENKRSCLYKISSGSRSDTH